MMSNWMSVVSISEKLIVLWYHTVYIGSLFCHINSDDKKFINRQILDFLMFLEGEYPA